MTDFWPKVRDEMHNACLRYCGDDTCCFGKQNSIVYKAITELVEQMKGAVVREQAGCTGKDYDAGFIIGWNEARKQTLENMEKVLMKDV